MRRALALRQYSKTGVDTVDRTVADALRAAYRDEAEVNEPHQDVVSTPEQRVAATPELRDVYLAVNTSKGTETILIKPLEGRPTGLTWVFTHPAPQETLLKVYDHTLAFAADRFPASSVYRQAVENLTKTRRDAVTAGGSVEDIEQRIGSGLIEEVLIQAAEEFRLLEEMADHKPWEELAEVPTEGQWTAHAFADQPSSLR